MNSYGIKNVEYDVFISYSRKDKRIVKSFCEIFTKAGITFWLDEVGIENGESFKTAIVKAIENAAVFLYFSSINSNKSPWTAKEVGIAVARNKPIIPIKLDNSPFNKEVEFDLVNLDFVECYNAEINQNVSEKLIISIKKRCQAALLDEAAVIEHSKKKRQKRRIFLYSSFIFLFLLCGGIYTSYSYFNRIERRRAEEFKISLAESMVLKADSLFDVELGKCFYQDTVKCFDSVSPVNLVLVRNLYDSASVFFRKNASMELYEKRNRLKRFVDTAYLCIKDKYTRYIEDRRKFTAEEYKTKVLEPFETICINENYPHGIKGR